MSNKRIEANGKKEGYSIGVHLKRAAIMLSTSVCMAFLLKLTEAVGFTGFAKLFTLQSLVQLGWLSLVFLPIMIVSFLIIKSLKKITITEDKMLSISCLSIVISLLFSWAFSALVNINIAPVLLGPLLVATLIDKKYGFFLQVVSSTTIFLLSLIWFNTIGEISQGIGSFLSSLIGFTIIIMMLEKSSTRLRFTAVGLFAGIAASLVPMCVQLAFGVGEVHKVVISGVWSAVSIILSISLYSMILPLLEQFFRICTTFRLGELCSLGHPLLKKLAKEAPGTFNHSLIVANLAELCAEAIGEDTQLAKAAAYYHDIGKIKNTNFFVENQAGYNPHDDVIPEISVSIIVGHVNLGYDILKDAKIPDVIANIALEHHGTTPVNYFLYKAQGYTEESVNKLEFSYPGPKPKTKIAAIIMIADTVEAASRAVGSFESKEQYIKFVRSLIKSKTDTDQFSDCPITFKELNKIEDALVQALISMYHARIKYDNSNLVKKN